MLENVLVLDLHTQECKYKVAVFREIFFHRVDLLEIVRVLWNQAIS